MNGDFNYDGGINADDYALIDFNLNAQGASLASDSPALTAVPEPAGAVGLLAAHAFLFARRRATDCDPARKRR